MTTRHLSPRRIRLIAGNANPALARAIAGELEEPLARAHVEQFPDGETRIKIEEDVRGSDAFILQSTCPPVNDNLMELLTLIDCLRRASAERITAVIPYFGYARQDRKDEGRVPITAKLVANMIVTAGADRVLTMDLHAAQIQGFFDIPVDHLYGAPIFIKHYRQMFEGAGIEDLVVLAPDVGSSKRAGKFAAELNAGLAVIDKRRVSAVKTEVVNVIGSVKGKNVLIADDMIATGGTLVESVKVAENYGAKAVYICATHPVLAGNSVERLRALSIVPEVAVTDTVPLPEDKRFETLRVLSTAPMLSEAIYRIHRAESISIMFRHS